MFSRTVATSALTVSSSIRQFRAIRRARRSRHCLLFAFQLRRSAVEAAEMVCARYWERTLYLMERAKSSMKASKPENFNSQDDDRSDASRRFDELEESLDENPTQKIGRKIGR